MYVNLFSLPTVIRIIYFLNYQRQLHLITLVLCPHPQVGGAGGRISRTRLGTRFWGPFYN